MTACQPQHPPAEVASPSVLMDADRAFAAAVRDGGVEAWVSWFATDGAQMAGLDDPSVSLSWEPLRADIAASGDLGWTTGTYVSEGTAPDGSVSRSEGRYVSIWRLQGDGSWKVVMDLGNPTGPRPGS
jgi:hypothetical protein